MQHTFVKHAPWFVDSYGSLSVWSYQRMEYSHYAAKSAYQRHTQHNGGKSKKSPLLQTYQHWYRIIQHRFQEQVEKSSERENHEGEQWLTMEAQIEKRREASLNSPAQAHHLLWRQKCHRIGSKWSPAKPI